MRALVLLIGVLFASSCGARQPPRPAAAELRTLVEPPIARVQVDEQFVGAARVLAQRPARLTPGRHRVTIEAPGYFPHDLELDLKVGVTKVEVKLRAVPP